MSSSWNYASKKIDSNFFLLHTLHILKVIAGILHLGFFASYLSEPLMRAYATGCAFYVIIAQVPGSFGLTLQRREGPLQLFYVINFFSHNFLTNSSVIST